MKEVKLSIPLAKTEQSQSIIDSLASEMTKKHNEILKRKFRTPSERGA